MIPFFTPNWSAPANVGSIVTLAKSGNTPFGQTNLALHVGDEMAKVQAARTMLAKQTGTQDWQWLQQVHGTTVISAGKMTLHCASPSGPKADACHTVENNLACAVLTADCLPVLFCDTEGSQVAAAHAGWRGLAAGMLIKTIEAMKAQKPGTTLLAYIGPAISPQAFEVGSEVLVAFEHAQDHFAEEVGGAFSLRHPLVSKKPMPTAKVKYMADLYALARLQLLKAGIARENIFGNCEASRYQCTYSDSRFYSFRRTSITGRFATAVWINNT